MSPTMPSKRHLSIILSLLASLPSKVCGFYFTIKELSELLSVGGCPHGLVNVDMVTQALRFNRGKFPGISWNRTNKIRFYKIVRGELMPSVSPNSQFKKNRPRMIPLVLSEREQYDKRSTPWAGGSRRNYGRFDTRRSCYHPTNCCGNKHSFVF